MKNESTRLETLARLGIVESTDENGDYEVQRIDYPKEFQQARGLSFTPLLLESDQQAKDLLHSITKINWK